MRASVLLGLLALLVVGVVSGGCGSSGPTSPSPGNPPGGGQNGPPPPLAATILQAPGGIQQVTLFGPYLRLNPQATASVRLAGQGAPTSVPAAQVDSEPRTPWSVRVDLGPIPLQPGLNLVELDAPSGFVLYLAEPASGGSPDSSPVHPPDLGRVTVGFEMLADGTVIAPEHVWLSLSVWRGPRRYLMIDGLGVDDYIRAEIHDSSGGVSICDTQANEHGFAKIVDPVGGLSDPPLWGPDSLLALYFVRNHDLLP